MRASFLPARHLHDGCRVERRAAATIIIKAAAVGGGVPHPALSANTVIPPRVATRRAQRRVTAITVTVSLPATPPPRPPRTPRHEHIPLPRRPLPPRLHPHPPPQNPDNQVVPRHILQVAAPLPHRVPHPLCRPLHPPPRLRLQHSHETLLHRINSLHPLPHEVQVQVRPLCHHPRTFRALICPADRHTTPPLTPSSSPTSLAPSPSFPSCSTMISPPLRSPGRSPSGSSQSPSFPSYSCSKERERQRLSPHITSRPSVYTEDCTFPTGCTGESASKH